MKSQGLGAGDTAEVEKLADLCSRRDCCDPPLNLGVLGQKPTQESFQFRYTEKEKLLGFLGVDVFLHPEFSGMVHPDHRRRGIGRILLNAARSECRQRGIDSSLLVSDGASSAGSIFCTAMGGRYDFSEHRMKLAPQIVPPDRNWANHLDFRRASGEEVEVLVDLHVDAFEDHAEEVRSGLKNDICRPERSLCVARLDGTPIGSLRILYEDARVFITSFGVRTGYQRQGYGRQILLRTIDHLLTKNESEIFIEVQTQNLRALSLYYSCGFRIANTFDYYSIQC